MHTACRTQRLRTCSLQAAQMVNTCAPCLAGQEGHASGGTDEEISWDIDFSAAEGDDSAEGTPADIDWDAGPAADGDAGVQKSEWDIELDADDTSPAAAPATEQGKLLTASYPAVLWLARMYLHYAIVSSSCQPAKTLVQSYARASSNIPES